MAALVGVVITASLGRWQLGRAAQKEQLQAEINERSRQAPLATEAFSRQVSAAGGNLQPLLHRRVELRGRWVPAATVFLDNRQMDGRAGFFVLTPLQLESGAGAVLVQRGWVPRNFQDRTQLPDVQTPVESVVVSGRISTPPSQLYEFTQKDETPGFRRIRQNLDLAAYRLDTGLSVVDVSVLQTGDATDGLLRNWPVVGAGVDKHYGYAFQWFGLCGLITLLYVWFQIVRRLLLPRRQPSA